MAWTQTDLDALDRAIASGHRRVKYGEDEVEYRTLADMWRTRQIIVDALVVVTGTPPAHTTYASFSKD